MLFAPWEIWLVYRKNMLLALVLQLPSKKNISFPIKIAICPRPRDNKENPIENPMFFVPC